MKKVILVCIGLSIFFVCHAQKQHLYKKNPLIGLNFTLHDFQSAEQLKYIFQFSDWDAHQLFNGRNMEPGFAISYWKGITDHLDWRASFGMSFLDYPIKGIEFGKNYALSEMDANMNIKILSDKHLLSPYVSIGTGVSYYKRYVGMYLPMGTGLQINFSNKVFIHINTAYRFAMTPATSRNHLFYSIGIAGEIKRKKEVVHGSSLPITSLLPRDRDNDGIVDTADACPDVPGLIKFKGCPDTDNDGIPDSEDKCPLVAGLEKYSGCPVRDTDHDGVNDEEDKCPAIPGSARFQGCPVPDTDKDGLNDEEDHCPTEPGKKENNGCPELEQFNFNAANVQFYTNSTSLTTAARKELDKAVVILQEHPTLNVLIEGHTDNSGAPQHNKALSQKRADAVRFYLVSKGVRAERLLAKGKGEEQPVGDNNTAEGRSRNRRVEFKVNSKF